MSVIGEADLVSLAVAPRVLPGDVIARQLRDGRRLRLDGHLAVALSNIARTMALNGVQDAVLNACLNANGLEAVPPP